MAFMGGDGQRMHSLHKCRGHGGSAAGLGSRESSHWFPLTGCWALRAALSPWRNLSSCIYIIIYMIFYIIIYIIYISCIISSISFVSSTGLGIPVWGRQNPRVLAKGKVFAAPLPLPPAGNPAAHPPVKLQPWKEKYEKSPFANSFVLFKIVCARGEKRYLKVSVKL